MKLNSTQIEQTLIQMQAFVLPEDNPAIMRLTEIFGDHTFFVDEHGLNVLESPETPNTEVQSGEVIRIADWNDEALTSLKLHAPEPTGEKIIFSHTLH